MVEAALTALEAEGTAMRGRYTPPGARHAGSGHLGNGDSGNGDAALVSPQPLTKSSGAIGGCWPAFIG